MKNITIELNGVIVGKVIQKDAQLCEVTETDKGESVEIRFNPVFLCAIPREFLTA